MIGVIGALRAAVAQIDGVHRAQRDRTRLAALRGRVTEVVEAAEVGDQIGELRWGDRTRVKRGEPELDPTLSNGLGANPEAGSTPSW